MSLTREQISNIYQQLAINTDTLGCIMLDVEPLKVSDVIAPDELYYSTGPIGGKYTQGIVSETVPHVTVLFGLMQSGRIWKQQVDEALEGWSLPSLEIASVTFFDNSTPEEQYYCVVAELELTPELLEGNSRLRILPHCDTFPVFRAHITLAYIKHDEAILNEILTVLNSRFAGKQVKALGLNYGD
jgi:2'-5' RNA ligase